MLCSGGHSLGCFAFSVAAFLFVTAQRWKMGHVYTLGGILMPKVLLLESFNAYGVLSLSLSLACSLLSSPRVYFLPILMNIPFYKIVYYVKSSFKYFFYSGELYLTVFCKLWIEDLTVRVKCTGKTVRRLTIVVFPLSLGFN